MIASGPTVAAQSSRSDCLQILNALDVYDRMPKSVQRLFNTKEETSSIDITADFVNNVIIADNVTALKAAADETKANGYDVVIIRADLNGEARDIGRQFAEFIDLILIQQIPINDALRASRLLIDNRRVLLEPKDWNSDAMVLLFGGETTVRISGTGIGGRNQEMALSFLIECNHFDVVNCSFAFLSAGTDGQDGPTSAAGAIIVGDNIKMDQKQLEKAKRALRENDSFEFFAKYDNGSAHVITGPTGTNVMDMQCIVLRRRR